MSASDIYQIEAEPKPQLGKKKIDLDWEINFLWQIED